MQASQQLPTVEEIIVERLASEGWCIQDNFLEPAVAAALAAECRQRWDEGEFRKAGVGIGAGLQVRPDIRRDHVHWLGDEDNAPALRSYMQRLDSLRQALNREMYLGLFEYEGHFAVYPPGAFYRKHLDQFRGTAHRLVSCILYLNANWSGADGGQLRMYLGERTLDIEPLAGRLVTFLSDRFEHEVLPAARERMSLTGWFRRRN